MVSWFQTRQGEGPRHYYLTPSHIIAWGREKGFLFHFHKAVHSSTVTTTWLWSSQALQWAFLHVNHSLFLHTFLTNIVAAGVCLLLIAISSKLFYFKLWSLPFVHPGLLSGHSWARGQRRGRRGESKGQCGLESHGGRTKLWSTIPKPRQMG